MCSQFLCNMTVNKYFGNNHVTHFWHRQDLPLFFYIENHISVSKCLSSALPSFHLIWSSKKKKGPILTKHKHTKKKNQIDRYIYIFLCIFIHPTTSPQDDSKLDAFPRGLAQTRYFVSLCSIFLSIHRVISILRVITGRSNGPTLHSNVLQSRAESSTTSGEQD